MKYRPWPLGKEWSERWERPEWTTLKLRGRKIDDARDVVRLFEEAVADFTGAPYAVAVDSCTNALYLCLKATYESDLTVVNLPKQTYISVPMILIQAGYNIRWEDSKWQGIYRLTPTVIWDCAMRFAPKMYIKNSLMCLSFQMKKRIPIGKGGMILTDNENLANRLRSMVFEGRHLDVFYDEDQPEEWGGNFYMLPEDAARGLIIFEDILNDDGPWTDVGGYQNYTDLSKMKYFKLFSL